MSIFVFTVIGVSKMSTFITQIRSHRGHQGPNPRMFTLSVEGDRKEWEQKIAPQSHFHRHVCLLCKAQIHCWYRECFSEACHVCDWCLDETLSVNSVATGGL